jgi:hypothetical protein
MDDELYGRNAFAGAAEGAWTPTVEASLHSAWSASAQVAADALPPAEAVGWWLMHADLGDLDGRERQLARLRTGLDVLIVRTRPPTVSRSMAHAPMLRDAWQAAQPDRTREELGFIAIELLDDCGAPVPDEPYVLELPDGRRLRGRLDQRGAARVDGIPRGTCVVKFPRVHETDVRAR